jgi:hypothetical protein
MNNNYNNIRKLKERILKNFYPVYHSPLVFDINSQTYHRKAGYIAWPTDEEDGIRKEERVRNITGQPYFAYPHSKSKII